MITRAGGAVLLSLLLLVQPLVAQRASLPTIPPACASVHELPDLSEMPPGLVAAQTASGAMYGFGGALLGGFLVGALAASMGTTEYERDTNWALGFVTGAAGGLLGGAVVGVHAAGRRFGLTASPASSSAGAAIGILGFALAPVGFFTVPYGAALGYQRTARYRCAAPTPTPDPES